MQNLNSDETGNFIYLIILLAFIASGFLFKGKIEASKAAVHLFVWTIFILILVSLYSFRHDFFNLKDRITSELFPARAMRIDRDKLSIQASKNGHYYINLNVNYKKVKFMIDTGASDIVLNQEDAKKANINMNDLSYTKIYQTANGKSMAASTIVDSIEISGVIFHNVRVSVNQSDMGTSLLGLSFLKKFKKYEFYQDQLILTY
jgi:aspartyl protease family protein